PHTHHLFLFYFFSAHLDLHSFPTRRSSDLARAAIDAAGGEVLLTARSEGFFIGRPDLEETVRRLQAFAEAGADCLYAPGIRSEQDRKSTRLNSSHVKISYAVFCLKKKNKKN